MSEDLLHSPPSNPSSIHAFGREAKGKLVKAREMVASYFQVKPQEVIFTSGGTESMSLLLKGLIHPALKPHIISSDIEHSCVEKTLLDLQRQGCDVSFLPAGKQGFVPLEDIQSAITPQTQFFVFGAANGETGVKIPDLAALADLALQRNISLLLDAIGWFGKDPFFFHPGILGAGFSAHKFHGPKGIGFCLLRSSPHLSPLFLGGGQEYGLRSGTENLTGILGLAKAIERLKEDLPTSSQSIRALRDRFEQNILSQIPSVYRNGTGERVCNVSNLCFDGVDAETLLIQLDLHGVLTSHGSACSSGALEPSRILLRMGLSSSLARSSLRFSLSKFNTQEEVDHVVKLLKNLVPRLRT
jgi:cysteine desulfurase